MACRNDFKNMSRYARFHSKVIMPENKDECWEWGGSYIEHASLLYGQFFWGMIDGKEKSMSAHRASWLINVGGIPDKLHVLHKCNNSKCVNYNHLYLGDYMQNMRDRDACGHTSKGAHRYNFIRTPELTERVIKMRSEKTKISVIMSELGVSRNTVYRCLGIVK